MVDFARGLPIAARRRIPLRIFTFCIACRLFLGCLAPKHIQYLLPSTIETYSNWVASRQLPLGSLSLRPDIEPVGETGAHILWIGDKNKAKKFVLFLHGGGYIAPMSKEHLNWMWLAYGREEVAVALLEYTLCPMARYPDQLRQSVEALRMLLSRGICSVDLVLGGDSAGGNLTVQLLRHIIDPHPDIKSLRLEKPLAGAFMVSPLVDGRVNTVSFQQNDSVDMLSSSLALATSKEMLKQDSSRPSMSHDMMRELAMPLESDMSWMAKLNLAVRNVYITVGNQEVFRDSVVAFSEAMRKRCRNLQVELNIGAKETHDSILFEGIMERPGEAMTKMHNWFESCI